MKKNKLIYIISFALSSIITNIMCIYVTYQWVNYVNNPANSAPGYVTLVYAFPFLIVITLLLIIGFIFF